MEMQEDVCITRLDAWIATIKTNTYKKNIKSENPEELYAYKTELESLEARLSKAIREQNDEALSALGLPHELILCITDMTLRAEILDHLTQAFTINHFNKSPRHAEELRKTTLW